MNLDQAQTPTTASHEQADYAGTRLHGGWLIFARIAWVVVLILTVGLCVSRLPYFFAQAQTICASVACSNGSYLTPDQARELRQLGLSMDFYATIFLLWSIALELVYIATGIVIFWCRSDEWMALISSLTLVTFGASFSGFNPQPPLAPQLIVLWLGLAFFNSCCGGLFFYAFPTGRFVPRWSGLLALGWIVYWGINDLILATILTNSGLDFVIFLGLLMSIIATQIYRYRHISTPDQRQQTKWVVYGVSLALVGVCTVFTLAAIVQSGIILYLIVGSLLHVFLLLIPLSIGIAILHSHLWDIDLIINRTLVYGTLTVSIVGIYVLVVGYLGTLFHSSDNLLISLIAAGLVAVAFQPLRVFLQRSVNRLLYGLRDEPYSVLAGLGQRLQATVHPDATLSTIVETVREALKLPYVAIELQEGADCVLAVDSGSPTARAVQRLPLLHQLEQVGTLLIAPRSGDDTLAPADLALIHNLADQIGVAVHAVQLNRDLQRMAGDLQRSRERLVLAREEERRRLRRDLHDDLGPTLAALALTASTVSDLIPTDPDAAVALSQSLQNEIRGTVGHIRRLVYELRPPALDELGLVGALRERAAQFSGLQRSDDKPESSKQLLVQVQAPDNLLPLPAAVEVATYRIVQEALTNVTRHAHARNCSIRLALTDALEVEILDDGVGLPQEYRRGVGLESMRERAAELGGYCTIEKRNGTGTRVFARLPIEKE